MCDLRFIVRLQWLYQTYLTASNQSPPSKATHRLSPVTAGMATTSLHRRRRRSSRCRTTAPTRRQPARTAPASPAPRCCRTRPCRTWRCSTARTWSDRADRRCSRAWRSTCPYRGSSTTSPWTPPMWAGSWGCSSSRSRTRWVARCRKLYFRTLRSAVVNGYIDETLVQYLARIGES